MSDASNDFDAVNQPTGDDAGPAASSDAAPSHQPARTVIISTSPKKKIPVFAWLIRMEGEKAGQAVQLQDSETLIGRDATRVHMLLDDPTVSSMHAKVTRSLDDEGHATYKIYDLGSSNGTWLGEEEIFEQELSDGLELRLGRSALTFKCL